MKVNMIQRLEVNNSFPEGWKRVKLGKVLKESKIKTDKDDIDKRISVKLHLGGVLKRNPSETNNIGSTQYFVRKAGQFIYGKQNLHKGALGIIPNELDGYLSTQDLPAFDVVYPAFNKYIYYYFARKHFYEKLSILALGTGSERIYPKDIYTLDIFLPPFKEQQKIAEILETVDKTIEKTDKIIEKYKKIKQGLMQDLLTKGIDENGKIRNPKTHKFKNSPLGKIPEEWEVVKLGEVSEIISGTTPKTNISLYWNGDINWFTPEDLSKESKLFIKNSKRKLTSKGVKSCSLRIIPAKSVIISSRAPIGYIKVALDIFTTNQGCKSIKANDKKFSSIFLAYLLLNKINEMLNLGTGTTFQEISKSDLKKLLIPLPPLPEQQKIAEILSQIDKTIEKEQEYKEKLQKLKKGLMEDLLTGKVRVKEN